MATEAPVRARRSSLLASGGLDTTDVKWMTGLFAVAFALRLWFALAVGQTPTSVLNDPTVYLAIAKNLANGHGFRGIADQATAQFPPAYPFLLSLVFRVFGVHPTAGAIVNVIFSAVTVPLLYFTARRTLGRSEAVFVGIGMTLLLSQVFYADLLLSDTLFTFLMVLLLALASVLDPGRLRSGLLLGLVLGLATLTRAVGAILVVIPIAIWWDALPWRHLARQAAVMVAVVLAFAVPWTVRNATAMRAFVPIATDSAPTLWAGHNPHAYGGPLAPPGSLLSSIRARPNTPAFELEEYRLLQRKALSWLGSHPIDELRLIPLKFLALFSGDGQTVSYYLDEPGAKKLLSPDAAGRFTTLANIGGYALLVAFFASLVVFGKALWRRRPILRGALVYLAISAVLYGFVFFGFFRYLAALEPLMLLVAAPLAARLWTLRAQRVGSAPSVPS
jgi:4-amino-4-deoxy-L-arabinose transferase-like glycosyltransferase